ncbi:MAG: alpha/beta hydrolase [Chitinophagales bacterium]
MKKLYILLVTVLFVSCLPIETDLPSGISETETINYYAFEPMEATTTGFIFYPGAGVEAKQYNSWLETLALEGYLTISTKMPFNLAVLDVNAALRIQNNFPDIDTWIIGGHSLGGAMSIDLVKRTQDNDKFDGLVLLAAYPGATSNISNWDGKVLSLSGSNDLVSTPEEIEEGKSRLPDGITVSTIEDFTHVTGSIYYEIEGGNHAQFGNYGIQNGDGTATISPEAQQDIIVQSITKFFQVNGW